MAAEQTRILVVDDEQPIIDLISGYMRREGYAVTSVGDGLAAVEAVRSSPPDVVILDVMLPGIDGVEACRQIRTFSDAYVLMLTARDEEIDRIVGLRSARTITSSNRSRRANSSRESRRCCGDRGPTATPLAQRHQGSISTSLGIRSRSTACRSSSPRSNSTYW